MNLTSAKPGDLVKRLGRVRFGYGLAFALGALVSHYVGWTRSGRSPEWLSIAAYVAVFIVCVFAVWTLYRFRRLEKMLRAERIIREKP